VIDASEDEYGNLRLSLGDYLEDPRLLVLDLFKIFAIFDNLLAFVFRRFEQFREREPLPRYVRAIVLHNISQNETVPGLFGTRSVSKLVIINAVVSISTDSFNNRVCKDIEPGCHP
jgi:hypothetical protein